MPKGCEGSCATLFTICRTRPGCVCCRAETCGAAIRTQRHLQGCCLLSCRCRNGEEFPSHWCGLEDSLLRKMPRSVEKNYLAWNQGCLQWAWWARVCYTLLIREVLPLLSNLTLVRVTTWLLAQVSSDLFQMYHIPKIKPWLSIFLFVLQISDKYICSSCPLLLGSGCAHGWHAGSQVLWRGFGAFLRGIKFGNGEWDDT